MYFLGLCEEACPKRGDLFNRQIVDAGFERKDFVFGKDKLVEKIDQRIDVTKRQTPEVLAFKKIQGLNTNELFDAKN